MSCIFSYVLLFFFNHTATTEIYTLSLHDALPIYARRRIRPVSVSARYRRVACSQSSTGRRSEEHTSELQSHSDLVCRLLLEKKKTDKIFIMSSQNGTIVEAVQEPFSLMRNIGVTE